MDAVLLLLFERGDHKNRARSVIPKIVYVSGSFTIRERERVREIKLCRFLGEQSRTILFYICVFELESSPESWR